MALKGFFVEVPPVVRPGRVHFSAPNYAFIFRFSLSQNDCRMPLPMESDSSCEQDFINHTQNGCCQYTRQLDAFSVLLGPIGRYR